MTPSQDGASQRRQQPPAADSASNATPTAAVGKDEADEQRVEDDDAEIARPSAQPADGLPPPRSHEFPERHAAKTPAKAAQTDPGLVGEQDVCQDQLSGKGLDARHFIIQLID